MDILKAQWYQQDGTISLNVPFAKVDEEKRSVSGFASLDNLDSQQDIVTAEASLKAFSSFRGNVREMHQPIAVGKVVEFTPETYYDQSTDKFYSGIYVTARISKGAQDTWEKVLDGTLSGFSIGGRVLDAENVLDQETQKHVQVIKDLELFELSLVDNPANPLANIVSIQKVDDVSAAVDSVRESVYACTDCNTVVSSMAEDRECPTCNKSMSSIGWIERNAAVQKEIKKLFDDYKTSTIEVVEKQNPLPETDNISEGENSMDNEEVQSSEEAVAEETPVAQDDVEIVDEQPVEEVSSEVSQEEAVAGAEQTEEIVEEQTVDAFAEIVSTLNDLKAAVSEVLASHTAQAQTAEEATAAMAKSVDAQIAAIKEEFAAALKDIKESVGSVEKRIDDVEENSAVKKSGDLGGEPEKTITRGIWDGSFLGISALTKQEGR